jgi:ATP-dependent RNA helicase DeaD
MNAFRDKTLQLLIATDVAARGIDVKEITHVINYELPDDTEVYTHRSGRTGRAGSMGICMSIVHTRETFKLRSIERLIQSNIVKTEIPTGKDVCRKQFYHFMDKLLQVDISHGDYDAYLPMLQEKFADVSKEDILKRMAATEFDRFLRYYENSEDLNLREQKRGERREFVNDRGDSRGNDRGRQRMDSSRDGSRGRERSPMPSGGGNTTRLFVNLGTKDGFYKASFLQFVLDMSDLRKDVLGRIDMKEMNSWVEIDKDFAGQMIKAVDGKSYKGRRIRMNDANSR